MIAVEKSHLESVDVRSVRRTQVAHIDQREVNRALSHVDPLSLETRLVLRGTVVRHSQVGPIQMVDAGHRSDSADREVFHDGGAIPCLRVDRAHVSGAGAATGPFERPFPLPGERPNLCESLGASAALSVRQGGNAQREKNGNEKPATHGDCLHQDFTPSRSLERASRLG